MCIVSENTGLTCNFMEQHKDNIINYSSASQNFPILEVKFNAEHNLYQSRGDNYNLYLTLISQLP